MLRSTRYMVDGEIPERRDNSRIESPQALRASRIGIEANFSGSGVSYPTGATRGMDDTRGARYASFARCRRTTCAGGFDSGESGSEVSASSEVLNSLSSKYQQVVFKPGSIACLLTIVRLENVSAG